MTLSMIDTFSGIGGFSLAARWLGGFTTVQFVEREPFCQRILRKHWPDVPIHDDICTFNPTAGTADVVVGGFPCQDISQAGKGAGLSGDRSGLFYQLIRVVRLVRPRYIVMENVAAILTRGLDDVLGTLAEAGYDAEWACIPAAAVGACHRRDRWWCVAYAGCIRQSRGKECHSKPKARITASLRDDSDGLGMDAPHAVCKRLERPDELAGGTETWPAAIARLSPDWTRYLSQPVICRGDDGFSGRVDRLKALGNAVVPQVAMIPLARVLQLEALP